ncbi:MAG: ATP-dependent helicase, partial [Candidatus Micrarchaeota archaeon]
MTLIEKIRAYIESDQLTNEQRKVCCQSGKFAVRACPGSGKTKTVGTRLAWRMATWKSRNSGVAALSFTNVAYEEIGQQLKSLGLPIQPGWPHFLGTIDSFVNQFIFLPFGHIVMGCNRRPEVVNDHNRAWVERNIVVNNLGDCYRKGCKSTYFSLEIGGGLRWCGPSRQPNCTRSRCCDMKSVMLKSGYALPGDAMYFGLKILEEKPYLRKALVARFPEIIIDEAQDTSETQVKIIELLAESGCEIALVGDPDQSIFEFNGARPDLFQRFEQKWPSVPLSMNFRSSQNICNATHRFSTLPGPAKAGSDYKDVAIRPLILIYPPGDETLVIDCFGKLLKDNNIERSKSAILVRRHDMLTKVSGKVTAQ